MFYDIDPRKQVKLSSFQDYRHLIIIDFQQTPATTAKQLTEDSENYAQPVINTQLFLASSLPLFLWV